MKLLSVIIKSLKEQWRSFWILALTLSMGPFFAAVYYLIIETSKPHYDVAIINNDKGYNFRSESVNIGEEFIRFFERSVKDSVNMPFTISKVNDEAEAIEELKNKKKDALVIIPENFSVQLERHLYDKSTQPVEIRFYGDLTNMNYLLSALWANEALNSFFREATGTNEFIKIAETGIGTSSSLSDFEMVIPGILIVSIIMLMFPATIAFVAEVENKTILRLKLSKITSLQFITGVTVVQVLVGIASILLTLLTAIILGFDYRGSAALFILTATLTSISIIAFSLIIAAVTKTANEVLIAGNFPLFLFMFFTGAAFPLRTEGLFSVFGYPVTLQGLMSPTHAISALNKILIMEMKLRDIIPELIALIILSVVYFIAGMIMFRNRHMTLK